MYHSNTNHIKLNIFIVEEKVVQTRNLEQDLEENQNRTFNTCAVRSNRRCNPDTWHEYGGYRDGCCTSEQPCGRDEGDCSLDSDCMPGLVCGKNNCPEDVGFGNRADCCEPISDIFQPGNHTSAIFL